MNVGIIEIPANTSSEGYARVPTLISVVMPVMSPRYATLLLNILLSIRELKMRAVFRWQKQAPLEHSNSMNC